MALHFYKLIQFGPIFPCVSCHRRLLERTVKEIDKDFLSIVTENEKLQLLSLSSPEFEVFDKKKFICKTCRNHIIKNKTPPLNFTNGLSVDSTPEWMMKLTSVGKSLISLDLPFLKVREIHKSGMKITNDRYINVPRTLDDVSKTVSSLPRKANELGYINVRLKRRMGFKTYHRFEQIDGQLINRTLEYLKENHPLYKKTEVNLLKNEMVHIDSSISSKSSESNSSVSSVSSKCQDLNNNISSPKRSSDVSKSDKENQTAEKNSSDSLSDISMISIKSNKHSEKKKTPENEALEDDNVFVDVTCLLPQNPERDVIINTSDKTLKKKVKRTDQTVYEIAPGEGKIPNNWLRATNFLLRAFPWLFSKGRYGLYHKREIKLSPLQFFSQRLLNVNTQFARDPDFLFVAEQFCERHAIEKQIDISGKKGTFTKTKQGVELNMIGDPFSIFKSIPGTPAYWKKFRNEIFARMEQLGHFHIFFTFSCAEMRFPEMIASVWQEKGHEVKFTKNPWDGKWDSIEVRHKNSDDPNGFVKLSEFNEQHLRGNTAFFKDHYILITRMFDSRVKAFITAILKNKVAYYSYRVEFQARGLPHIHGIAWLKNAEVGPYLDEKGNFKDDCTDLIEKWVSVSLESDNTELNQKVRESQIHDHRDSCKKKGTFCRFNFPRPPSNKTIIAKPLPEEMPEEEKLAKLEKAEFILTLVKAKLIELDDTKSTKSYTLEEFLAEINEEFKKKYLENLDEATYHDALGISERGKIIILKRTVMERNVNNFNPYFLSVWNANCDLQVCLDNYSVITYITDYFSKGDAGLTRLLKKALQEKKGNLSDSELNHYLKRQYFISRQVCVSEATYRLILGLDLKGSNVASKHVDTSLPEKRSAYFRRIGENDNEKESSNESENDDEDNNDGNTPHSSRGIRIKGREGHYMQCQSHHDRYTMRPSQLKNICFAQFMTHYDSCKRPKTAKFSNDCCYANEDQKFQPKIYATDEVLPKYILLSNGACLRLRAIPKIIGLHHKKQDYEALYAELILFLPWSEEGELCADDKEAVRSIYIAKLELIELNKRAIFPNTKRIQEIREFMFDNENAAEHLYDKIDVTAEQENDEVLEEIGQADLNPLPEEPSETPKSSKSTAEELKLKPIIIADRATLRQKARSLSYEQRIVFDDIVHYSHCVAIDNLGGQIDAEPPIYIVHGKLG